MKNKTKKFNKVCKTDFFKIKKTKKKQNNFDKLIDNFILFVNKNCNYTNCEFKIKLFFKNNLIHLDKIYEEYFLKIKNEEELKSNLENLIINILFKLFNNKKNYTFFLFEKFKKTNLFKKKKIRLFVF